jgi:sugar phosphate isomerase/epimerase
MAGLLGKLYIQGMKSILCFVLVGLFLVPATAQKNSIKPEIGIAEHLENDSLITANGYRYLVESISKLFSPLNVSDDQFRANLEKLQKLKTPMYAGYLFIPGELKLVGPEINEAKVLEYVTIVFQRCQKAGVNLITWGSGGARRVPDGFDKIKAKEQFISIAKKIAAIAGRYKIVLALENLNSTETNFINTLSEAIDIVNKVDHPNFKLCVDIYHMLKENESPSVIAQARKIAVHCDIAEKENRTPPGVAGQDFKEYLAALRKIGYNGKIIIESRWENLGTQAGPARNYLQNQIDEVYK